MNPQTIDVYMDIRPSCMIDPEHPQADSGMPRRHACRICVMRDSPNAACKHAWILTLNAALYES